LAGYWNRSGITEAFEAGKFDVGKAHGRD
jgi:hypothetical protein